MSRLTRLLLNAERSRHNLPVIGVNKIKLMERKKTQLTKKLIDVASTMSFHMLKSDTVHHNRRLKFMYFIEDLDILFQIIGANKNILVTFPKINNLPTKYSWSSGSIYTALSSLVDLEEKDVIKDALNDGVEAIEKLRYPVRHRSNVICSRGERWIVYEIYGQC